MGSADSPPPNAHPRWPLAALGAITLVGLALRLTNVGESLWLDELHTGWVVKDAWSDVAWRAQIGNQSPVWFYAVKVVTTLGGASEFTLRLLSLLAGTALMPVAYWLVRLFVSRPDRGIHSACGLAGLLAAALIAIDPNCIFYATEARPYACLQLSAALQLGLFWQILWQPTTQLRLGWMLLTALTFHLHYTGILILLGELIVLLGYYLLARKPVAYRPWRALFDWQIAAMLCLPAIGHVLEVGRRREMWDSMSAVPKWLDLITLFPLYATLAVGLLACGFAIVHWYRGWKFAKSPSTLVVIALWFCVPLLAVFAAAHFDLARMFLRRYLMTLAIGPMLLTALLVTRMPSIRWQWLVACGALGYAVYESNIVQQMREDGRTIPSRGEDWRGAIAALKKARLKYPDSVIISAGLIEELEIADDEALLSGDFRSPPTNKDAYFEYLKFPLFATYDAGLLQTDVRSAVECLSKYGRSDGMTAIEYVWLISRNEQAEYRASWTVNTDGWPLRNINFDEFGAVRIKSGFCDVPPTPP